jgi:outer membrane receptor protein involved in Fe transport
VYLENTNIEGSKLPGYFVLDARLATDLAKFIGLKNTTIALMANNLTNTLYAPAGLASVRINRVNGIDTPIAIPSFFPAAGINFMASLNMKF